MELEIDFLPVGEKTQSGDAIVMRFGNLSGTRDDYSVVVIDSGFQENGDQVVNHIKNVYGTDKVDLVISTHPDNDHAGGIPKVLEKLKIGKIWMHKPWEHTDNIAKLFQKSSVADKQVEQKIIKSLATVKSIEEIAKEKGIEIEEPFTGKIDQTGKIIVLGPDEDFYKNELIPNFKCTPEPEEPLMEKLIKGIRGVGEAIKELIDEAWNIETLDEKGSTSAENNSSVIILLNIDGQHILFTADAGQPALERVIKVLDSTNYNYSQLKVVQVPHHGSYRNVNPYILDKIIGSRLEKEDRQSAKIVVVASISKELDEKHPSKIVTNAFKRRGGPVHITSGELKYYSIGEAPRKGLYPNSEPLPFFNKVERHED
ncbi:MAG: MBL fold metallo-hydrolase [Candidatus Paceibacterota bacterium]|jgi:beta-lactamase superfamily II metal-dependent hydrolase